MQEHLATTGEPDDLPETFGVNGEGLPEKVFSLRQKLYRKAKQEPKFRFYALYDREGHYLNLIPSAKALQRVRDRLREMTDARQCFTPIRQRIERIHRMLRGWQGYFSQGYPQAAYRDVDSYTLRRLRTHLHRRSQRGYKKPKSVTWWDHLQRLGWTPLQQRRVKL